MRIKKPWIHPYTIKWPFDFNIFIDNMIIRLLTCLSCHGWGTSSWRIYWLRSREPPQWGISSRVSCTPWTTSHCSASESPAFSACCSSEMEHKQVSIHANRAYGQAWPMNARRVPFYGLRAIGPRIGPGGKIWWGECGHGSLSLHSWRF